jgi:protein-S-isoprenylcysteine O-methyltransferase Ste14
VISAQARRTLALSYGFLTHGLFAGGVALMMVELFDGLQDGVGGGPPVVRALVDAALLLQFPLLHSFLLSERGRRILRLLAPRAAEGTLDTTVFAAVASLQLVVVFGLWAPSGVVWWVPTGPLFVLSVAAYAASWVFLLVAMRDAGIALQTGSLGWTAWFRGRRPAFGPFPRGGLFRSVRQPVYLAFALTLWTGPVWTPDRLVLALGWTAYCVLGPRLKERRYLRRYGDAFARYRDTVPYLLPLRRTSRNHARTAR